MPPEKRQKSNNNTEFSNLTPRENRRRIMAVWWKLHSINNTLNKNKLTEAINLLTNLRSPEQGLSEKQREFFNKLMLEHIDKCVNTNKLYEAGLLLNEAELFLKEKLASMTPNQEKYREDWERLGNKYHGKCRNLSGIPKRDKPYFVREDKLEVDLFSWLNSGKSDIELAETLVFFIKQQALPHSLFVPLIINAPSSAHNSVAQHDSQRHTRPADYVQNYPETILSFEKKLRDIDNRLNEIKKKRTEPTEQHSTIHAKLIVETILEQWIPQQKKMESSIGNEASLFKPATKSEKMASSKPFSPSPDSDLKRIARELTQN